MKAPHAALLVHLSDLHIVRDAARQALVLDRLVDALGRERAASSAERIVVTITGDVFDSATDPAPELIDTFLRLHARVVAALGGDAPTIVLPGNHDRRRLGLLVLASIPGAWTVRAGAALVPGGGHSFIEEANQIFLAGYFIVRVRVEVALEFVFPLIANVVQDHRVAILGIEHGVLDIGLVGFWRLLRSLKVGLRQSISSGWSCVVFVLRWEESNRAHQEE